MKINLIACVEDCEYQQEGYCRLTGGAPVSSVQVGGCCYFQPKGPKPRRETGDFAENKRE